MSRSNSLVILATGALVALASMGCSTSSSAGATTADGASGGSCTNAEPFIPYPSDMCGYKSWKKYVEPDAGGDGVIVPSVTTDGGFIHAPGGRIEYINTPPAHGSTEFAPGTIIVKEIPGQPQIFAMAKVCGGYNPNGPDGQAINWEWFELAPVDCEAGFVWQGYTPPSNQSYGGTPNACNDCHSGFAKSNDFVASGTIKLKNY
jgi:hypothetical protein